MVDPRNYIIGDHFHYDSGIFVADTLAKIDKFRNQSYLPLVGLISFAFVGGVRVLRAAFSVLVLKVV